VSRTTLCFCLKNWNGLDGMKAPSNDIDIMARAELLRAFHLDKLLAITTVSGIPARGVHPAALESPSGPPVRRL
jgi:hypothetical protein